MEKSPETNDKYGFNVTAAGLFKRFGNELKQAVLIDVSDGVPRDAEIDVCVHRHRARYRLSDLPEFNRRRMVFIPEVKSETSLVAKLMVGDKTVVTTSQVKPEKHWTFFILHHTHFDLGYTDRQDRVWELHYRILDDVIQFCQTTSDYPEDSRFKYIIEGASLLYHWKENRPKSHFQEMLKLIKEERVEVLAFHSNLLTELCGHEMLIRGLYHAGELRDRFGISIRSAMINDIPGYTWIIPELLSNMGVEYLNLRGNYYRGKFLWYRPGAVPRPFMWQAPSGKSVLTWYTDSYREANSLRKPEDFSAILEYLDQAKSQDWYPYSFYPLRLGGDNNTACLEVSNNIRIWNETWEWPKLVLSTNSAFFDHAAGHGPYPTYKGDIPDWWADGACSSAQETAAVRIAQEKLLSAEKIFAGAEISGSDVKTPVKQIDRAYENLVLYVEHTWGDSDTGPDPYSERQKEQWAMKKGYADEGVRRTDRLYENACASFVRSMGTDARDMITVFNPLSWSRTDVVTVRYPDNGRKLVAVDMETGQKSSVQRWMTDPELISFKAINVPAFGWNCYRIEETAESEGVYPQVQDYTLDFSYYSLTLDKSTGSISSLVDKETGAELVDPVAQWKLNQFIYNAERRPLTSRWMKTVMEESGPVFCRITSKGCADWFPQVIQSYTIVNGIKRLDIHNVYEKEERIEREALYTAFPFAIRNPHPACEITDAVMRPEVDQLPASCRDFYSVQHWVRINGDGASVLLAAVQAPLVQFDDINTDRWLDRLDIRNGHLYAYLLNNHWRTNYKPFQSGCFEYDYSITSSRFPFTNTQSVRFGWEKNAPLVVIPNHHAPARSVCTVSEQNIILNNLKKARDGRGFILRLWEIEGKPTNVVITLPGQKLLWAFITDPVEKNMSRLKIQDDSVEVPVNPYEVKTVRIVLRKN